MKSTARILHVDLCVYGGTSGGVVAAVAAAQQGLKVVLVEPGRHLGGMSSGGLGLTDHGKIESIGGLSREFYRRIAEHDRRACPTPDDHPAPGDGWSHVPHVAEAIFNAWVREHGIQVVFEHRLAAAARDGASIREIRLDHAPPDAGGAPAAAPVASGVLRVSARVFIDASYEGDLMAAAGVRYTTRRESSAAYGEAIAGVQYSDTDVPIDPFVEPGRPASGLLPLVQPDTGDASGAASDAVQAYTFRLCLSRVNMRPLAPPADYDPSRYEIFGRELVAWAAAGRPLLPRQFYHPPRGQPWVHPRMLKMSPVPDGKTDVNNCGGSTDFIGGGSSRYAEAGWPERAAIWRAHENHVRGLFHFMRTDPRALPEVRAEVAKWGLPNDEFTDTGGWPHQLYIRESRRMLGAYVMTQKDVENRTLADSVGLGSYALDSHHCRRIARGGRVVFEGGFWCPVDHPYPIPYRALTPREDECRNLLVLFCLSSSHAAYSSLRMEPVLMILGQSAAVAAGLAIAGRTSVQAIDISALRTRLRKAGQMLDWPKQAT